MALPQLRRRENSIFLWNLRQLDYPVHCFYGHKDAILDFEFFEKQEEESLDMVKS